MVRARTGEEEKDDDDDEYAANRDCVRRSVWGRRGRGRGIGIGNRTD